MDRITCVGLTVAAVLTFVTPLAFAQDTVAIGKKGEVQFSRETRIGSTLLKPGHYQFQHQSNDGQHYLVIRERQPFPSGGGTHVVGGGGGRELAWVPCRVVSTGTGDRTRATMLYWKADPDGVQRITRINIIGETESHVITLEPQS